MIAMSLHHPYPPDTTYSCSFDDNYSTSTGTVPYDTCYYISGITITTASYDDNTEISTEELKALTKVKQEFDRPDNIEAPFMMVTIPKTNKRLSQLRQRHTR